MTKEGFDRYLWDRSGEPDEQLRTLEALLERYRYERTAPEPPDGNPSDAPTEDAPT